MKRLGKNPDTYAAADRFVEAGMKNIRDEMEKGVSLGKLAAHYARHTDVKGEIVIVIGAPDADTERSADTIDEALREAIERIRKVITRISDIQNTIATAVEEQTARAMEAIQSILDKL